ncbi:MAG: hypothetical protein IPP29_10485 [Bacteroidetes bacterium]|nr:hypothetical protein [Bacteroidota bacterium]
MIVQTIPEYKFRAGMHKGIKVLWASFVNKPELISAFRKWETEQIDGFLTGPGEATPHALEPLHERGLATGMSTHKTKICFGL